MTMIKSEMAGTVWKVLVKEGDTVEIGQEVVIIESMKMEIPVESEIAGTVKQVITAPEAFVNVDDDLIEIE